jgi:hypothetical protein
MGPFGGIMTECGTNQPIEKVLAAEDAVSSNAWIFFNMGRCYIALALLMLELLPLNIF